MPPVLLAPVAVDDAVMVAYGETDSHRIASLDAGTGRLRWEKTFPEVYFTGMLCAGQGLLCANTRSDGSYLLRTNDGTLKTRLSDAYVWAGTQKLILLTTWDREPNKWPSDTLTALDVSTLRPLWRKPLAPWRVFRVEPRKDVIEVMLVRGWAELGTLMRTQLTLRAASGETISRSKPLQRASNRTIDDLVPKGLPSPVRTRLSTLLARKSSVFLGCTRIVRQGDLFLGGNLEDATASSVVYGIRADTGRIAWRRAAPGLKDIALRGSRLFVAYGLPAPYAKSRTKSLMALDARNGRVLWRVRLGRRLK